MSKKSTSALHDLFVAVRRVVVLLVAAFALAMDWPLSIVAARVLILWASLVILTSASELLFRYLSHHATIQESDAASPEIGRSAAR